MVLIKSCVDRLLKMLLLPCGPEQVTQLGWTPVYPAMAGVLKLPLLEQRGASVPGTDIFAQCLDRARNQLNSAIAAIIIISFQRVKSAREFLRGGAADKPDLGRGGDTAALPLGRKWSPGLARGLLQAATGAISETRTTSEAPVYLPSTLFSDKTESNPQKHGRLAFPQGTHRSQASWGKKVESC